MRRDDGGGGSATDDGFEQVERRRVTEELAAAVRGAANAHEAPRQLCLACVRLLPITGASVSLSGGRAVRTLWCASDDTAARLAEAQYTLGDGPCQNALDLAAPVLAADLSGRADARRWPVFAQQALELGVRAVFSLPLGIGAQALGTLDLYRSSAGGLSSRNLRTALLVRDAVTFAVLNLQPAGYGSDGAGDGGVASWVAAAEADHAEVHRAVGMVMVQLGVDPDQALDRLRARAFTQGRSVTALAQEVIARTQRFSPHDDHEVHGDHEGGQSEKDEGR